jgi:putative holliday junction resolvase
MFEENRILGIDYGGKRIGVAMSDPMCIIASGIGVLQNDQKLIPNLINIVDKYKPKEIVIGLPVSLSGESHDQTKAVLDFTEKLKVKINIPITHWDERFTSKIAENTLIDVGLNKKKRQQKERLDEISAILILQGYIDYKNSNKAI